MANYYTEVCVMVKYPPDAEHADASDRTSRAEAVWAAFDAACDSDPDGLGYNSLVASFATEGVIISADESADIDQLLDIVQQLMVEFQIMEPTVVQWAHTCSKMRVDAFGGGAAVVTTETIVTVNATDAALRLALEELATESSVPAVEAVRFIKGWLGEG
jgi:hypothetical protein